MFLLIIAKFSLAILILAVYDTSANERSLESRMVCVNHKGIF